MVSYAANRRTHEIGIRAALGAQPKRILTMVLCQGGTMVASGLIAGILASVAMSHLVGNFLVGVSAVDPLTYFAVSALLATVACSGPPLLVPQSHHWIDLRRPPRGNVAGDKRDRCE